MNNIYTLIKEYLNNHGHSFVDNCPVCGKDVNELIHNDKMKNLPEFICEQCLIKNI